MYRRLHEDYETMREELARAKKCCAFCEFARRDRPLTFCKHWADGVRDNAFMPNEPALNLSVTVSIQHPDTDVCTEFEWDGAGWDEALRLAGDDVDELLDIEETNRAHSAEALG